MGLQGIQGFQGFQNYNEGFQRGYEIFLKQEVLQSVSVVFKVDLRCFRSSQERFSWSQCGPRGFRRFHGHFRGLIEIHRVSNSRFKGHSPIVSQSGFFFLPQTFQVLYVGFKVSQRRFKEFQGHFMWFQLRFNGLKGHFRGFRGHFRAFKISSLECVDFLGDVSGGLDSHRTLREVLEAFQTVSGAFKDVSRTL